MHSRMQLVSTFDIQYELNYTAIIASYIVTLLMITYIVLKLIINH